MRNSLRITIGAVLSSVTLTTAACSGPARSGTHHGFMPSDTVGAVSDSGIHVGQLTEIYVSFPSNSAAGPVHVLSVRLVDLAPNVHVQATEAFRVRGLPGLPSSGQVIYGTRSAGCPRNYLGPQPVTAITLAPHKAGHWIATILLTVTAPGSYHFSKAKITYTVDGVKNWQYQDLGLVVSYTDPPRPELAHIYRQDDGCDAL
jgi:hypothetical protein